jgi:putative transposase
MRIQSLNHSTYQHQYHIVWGTKYRRKFLKPYVKDFFVKTLYSTTKKYPTLYIHAVNVDDDHVHLQIEIPPNLLVSKVVKTIKTNLSIALKKRFKFIRNMYIDGKIWSVGYFSSTLGLNEEMVQRYIQKQGEQDIPHPALL